MTKEPHLSCPATMTIFDEYGKDDTIEIKGLSFSLSNTALPASPIPKIRSGEFNVSGTIEAYWTSPQLFLWFRAAQAAMENRMLRIARPHMGKRQFQRFRGTLCASRKAAWRKADESR